MKIFHCKLNKINNISSGYLCRNPGNGHSDSIIKCFQVIHMRHQAHEPCRKLLGMPSCCALYLSTSDGLFNHASACSVQQSCVEQNDTEALLLISKKVERQLDSETETMLSDDELTRLIDEQLDDETEVCDPNAEPELDMGCVLKICGAVIFAIVFVLVIGIL